MVDPNDITDFSRDELALQEFLLFSVCVAGKTAATQSKKLDQFLSYSHSLGPFAHINKLDEKGQLLSALKACKMGQYKRISRCFKEVSKTLKGRLHNVSMQELIGVKGIGHKTANFFLLHSRKGYVGAALDTHILKFLRENGYAAPKSTPSASSYFKWQEIFLDICKKRWPNRSIAEIDLEIWKQQRAKIGNKSHVPRYFHKPS